MLLAENGFDFPSAQEFESKIKQVFGYDIKENTNDIIEVELNPLIEDEPDTVSYTHLTLPTNSRV